MIKRLLKWAVGLLVLALVLGMAFLLSLDSVLRLMVEHNVRAQTGLEAHIGKFHLGLTEPVIEIKNLRLYNSAEFGRAPFLTIPEIHVEYDRAALARNQIHITLLRFNLGELDIVKSQDGQTNLLSLGVQLPTKPDAVDIDRQAQDLADLKKRTGLGFQGIDCLNVSVGEFKYLDLQDQKNNREQKIGIDNCVITNVTSAADLVGLGVLVGLRSGDFFQPLIAPGDSNAGFPAQDLLKLLGH